MTQVQIGQQVPDFILPASNGGKVSLSDYRGKYVVLYFYPKDMTPGCTTESCDFRDYNEQFEQSGSVVLGISPDDLTTHNEFIAKHELPFLLLSDIDHQVCQLFGVWVLKNVNVRESMGVERSTFLIDPEGKLVKEWHRVVVLGHVEEVLRAVKGV